MPPDAIIVIFGAAVRPDGQPSGTMRRRVDAAHAFAARFIAPVFIPTGGQGRFGAPESSVMAGLLAARCAAPAKVLEEPTGTDTLSSVVAVARLIRVHDLRAPIFAATSGYHLPRCLLLLRLAGLEARPCPPPPAPAARRFGARWYWRLREVPAIPFDAALIVAKRVRGQLEPGRPRSARCISTDKVQSSATRCRYRRSGRRHRT